MPYGAKNHERPTQTTTFFFRERNLAYFSEIVAPDLQVAMGGVLRVANVGCSSGEETWSLASALSVAGVNYEIEAFDANPDALQQADMPYLLSAQHLQYTHNLRRRSDRDSTPAFADACLDYFDPISPVHILPAAELRRRVTFKKLNILHEPLEAAEYGAVVVNNVLYHYGRMDGFTMIKNMVHGLRPGGMFLYDGAPGAESALNINHLKRVEPDGPYAELHRWARIYQPLR